MHFILIALRCVMLMCAVILVIRFTLCDRPRIIANLIIRYFVSGNCQSYYFLRTSYFRVLI